MCPKNLRKNGYRDPPDRRHPPPLENKCWVSCSKFWREVPSSVACKVDRPWNSKNRQLHLHLLHQWRYDSKIVIVRTLAVEQIHLVVVWTRRRWWRNYSLLTNRVPLHFCVMWKMEFGIEDVDTWARRCFGKAGLNYLPPHESSSDVPLLHFEPPPSPNDTCRWRLHLEPPPSPNVLLRTTSDLSPGGFHLETPPSPAAPMAIEDSG